MVSKKQHWNLSCWCPSLAMRPLLTTYLKKHEKAINYLDMTPALNHV